MFENEDSYIFLQKEQRKNNGLTHKMEYRWQKRECICKKQKIILFTPVIWQGKIPDGVLLLSTSCGVLQGFPALRKTISSHV